MLLIPIGLRAKLVRWPILSILLIVAIAGVSVPYFTKLEQFAEKRKAAFTESGLVESTVALVKEDCPRRLSDQQCVIAGWIMEVKYDETMTERQRKKKLTKLIDDQMKRKPASVVSFGKDVTVAGKYVSTFDPLSPGKDHEAEDLDSYSAWQEAVRNFKARIRQDLKESSLLSRSTPAPKELILAQFIHGGWMHLIGNLIVFIGIAIFLEQRYSALEYLAIFFLGGCFGLMFEIYFMGSDIVPLMGASANVSAVMGAFLVAFRKRRTRVFISALVYNKVIEVPTAILIPVFYLANDISGALARSDGGGPGVANLAHLMGFAGGAMLAYAFDRINRLPDNCLFPDELPLLRELQKSSATSERIQLSERVLTINPGNWVAIEHVATRLASSESEMNHPMSRQFMATHLRTLWDLSFQRKDLSALDEIFKSWPKGVSWIECLDGAKQRDLLAMAGRQLKAGEWRAAIALYDAYRAHYPRSSSDANVVRSVSALLEHLRARQTDLAPLREYVSTERRTTFSTLLREHVSDAV